MQKKQVAIIDIGSSAITAVVGERGINRTFVIKSRFVFNYEGFESGAFFDVEQVERILFSAVSNIKKVMNCLPDTVYVGVPGDFTQVVVKDSHISFSKKKKK